MSGQHWKVVGTLVAAEPATPDPREAEELEELPELVGRTVEIHGVDSVQGVPLVDANGPLRDIEVGGQTGICISYDRVSAKFAVQTFEGALVSLPAENLRLHEAPLPEEGGFDLAWVGGPSQELAQVLFQCLGEKGYCVIQTSMSPEERAETMDFIDSSSLSWDRMRRETVEGYFGFNDKSKFAVLENDDMSVEHPDTPLKRCDRLFSQVAATLAPSFPSAFGSTLQSKMSPMVRMPVTEEEEEYLGLESLNEGDVEDGVFEDFLHFVHRRKVSMLQMVENDGGDLWLFPVEGSPYSTVKLPLSRNKLLIFRQDLLSYSYEPTSDQSLALQTWLLSEAITPNKVSYDVDYHHGIASLGFVSSGKAPRCCARHVLACAHARRRRRRVAVVEHVCSRRRWAVPVALRSLGHGRLL